MKTAFDHIAGEYDVYRPSYPAEALDMLGGMLAPDGDRHAGPDVRDRVDTPVIVDVAAGTGIFSRQLAARGWRVIAVEPSVTMLRVGIVEQTDMSYDRRRLHPIAGGAERIPIASETIDLITAAQAFHWFNPPIALAEFARVLRPGGAIALLWNNRDPARHPIVDQFEELIRRYNPAHDREYRQQDWPAKIAQTGCFEAMIEHRIEWEWKLTADQLVGFSRTISYVRNVIARDQLPRFEAELRSLAMTAFPDGVCRLPMWTGLWTARRLAR